MSCSGNNYECTYSIISGHMLVAWLCSTFDEQHYLYYMLSKVDLKVIAIQFCTHLLAAGVIKRLEEEETPVALFRVGRALLLLSSFKQ